MKKPIDYTVIESILSVLDSFAKDNSHTDTLPETNQSTDTPPSMTQNLQAAYFLKQFTDEMPGGFFIYHADGQEEIIYANEAMLHLFGCETLEEFKKHTDSSFRGIVHPDDLDAVEISIREQVAVNNGHDYVEYRIIQKNGKIRWVEDYGHLIHSDTLGDIFYVFVYDATVKMQRRLKEKETLLNETKKKELLLQRQIDEYDQELKLIHLEHLRRLELIEGLSIDYESIFYVDLDADQLKPYRISSRIAKQFPKETSTFPFSGFDADYLEKWVYPPDRDIIAAAVKPEYIREKLADDKFFNVNYRVLRDGTPSYIQLRVVNVGDEDHISQIVLGYRDIDKEMLHEMEQNEKLAQALKEAKIANSAKNLFLSNMSHDIRTPMNAIISYTALAKKHANNQERLLTYLNTISEFGDKMLQLLGDVLEITRIESGNIYVEERECSLMEILHQVQLATLPRTAAKQITLSLDFANLRHDNVYTDPQKLTQTLMHLVDNSVKYTKYGGWIVLTVIEKPKDGLSDRADYLFVVEDNGIGISAAFLSRIFNPFERAKNTTASGIHGTGLGLTITKNLVEIMGGAIDVTSTIGEGSKFTIMLPMRIHEQQPMNDSEPALTAETVSAAPKRILVVDDNEINREIENEVLKDAGYLVDTASDGNIAYEKIKQSKPGDYDLILMDIQMPVMDGYHATRAIRQMDDPILAGIPIIAVSANTFEEDKRKALESGMNAHLGKPLDTSQLYKLIRKFLSDVNTNKIKRV